MDRLTHKKYPTTDCENVFRVLKEGTTNKFVVGGKAITKLKDFEDFLEKQGFESLEQFEMRFNTLKTQLEGDKRVIDLLKQVIEDYKTKWRKLNEWVVKQLGYTSMYQEERLQTLNEFKDKLQELEKDDKK